MFPATGQHGAGRVAGGGGKGWIQLALVHAVEQVGRKAAATVELELDRGGLLRQKIPHEARHHPSAQFADAAHQHGF